MKQECIKKYHNVYYQPGAEPIFCYRTGLTVYEESFSHGALIARGWNGAGYPLNVLSNSATRLNPDMFMEPQSFHLDVDGEYCDWGLSFVDYNCIEEDEDHTHAVITLRCDDKKILIKVHTILDGSPVFSRWLEIINENDKEAAISELGVMSGGIETMGIPGISGGRTFDTFYKLGYFDADGWGKEGDFSWHNLTPDLHSFGGRYNRERFRHPIFFLQNTLMGTTMVGQMAWSGGYKFTFDYNAHQENQNTSLSFKLEMDSLKPLIVLKPGETLCSPAMHIGRVIGDHNDAVNAMHEHTRKSVLTVPGTENKCLVGAGMGPEHDMNVDTTKQFMDQMARAGSEVFIVDAGWYCPPGKESSWHSLSGNWVFDKERYPNGLEEIRDYCRSLGMKFGLWMEAERIGSQTETFAQHHDWYTTRRNGVHAAGYLDFSNPDAAAWAESQAARVIEEYQLDLFRIDYNVSGIDYFHVGKQNDRRECRSIRQIEGFYRMYSNLKRRFPNVIFENCAGGGGRTDLGMLANFNHTWVSDRQTAPRSFEITNGMTMAIPPDRVDRLVAGMGCHEFASLNFQMRNAMFGHISLNVFGPKSAEMNPQVFEFISHSVDIYKSFIRPYLPNANIYHHTPDINDIKKNAYAVLELSSQDYKRDTIGIFTMPGFSGNIITVYPRGLNSEYSYRVTFDNARTSAIISGYQLITQGININIRSVFNSELITIEIEDNI